MKKLAIVILVIVVMGLAACGNKDWFDTDNNFNKAIVRFPDNSVREINLKSWCDYEGEQIKLVEKSTGTIYIVNSVNCVLVCE